MSMYDFQAFGLMALLRLRYKVYLIPFFLLVENIGVEPMTPCLQSKCSSQLS